MTTPKGYSGAQIRLHWIIAVLIVFQLVMGEDMGAAWRAVQNGGPVALGVSGWAHILVGIAVLALAFWRLGLRWTRGVPEAPAGGSPLQARAGELAHKALYLLMILAPISGLVAWYGGVGAAAAFHELLKPALIILIALHVLAALWHQFGLRDGLIDRMRKPLD